MDREDTNQRPANAGWLAALEAERVRIATQVLPIAIGFSVVLGVFFVGIYIYLGRPWQWAWMVVECFQATVLFIIASALVRRGYLTATVCVATLGVNLTVLIGPALVEGMIVPGIFSGMIAIIFARLIASRALNRIVILVSAAALVTGILLSGFQVFEVLPTPIWIQAVTGVGDAIMVVFSIALVLDSRDRRYEDALSQADTYAKQLDSQRATLEERARELEETTAALAVRSQELEGTNVRLEEARRRQEAVNRELQEANERTRRRAARLLAVAEVGRVIARVRDPERLLPQVTQLISQHFGYYHVGIFLVDRAGRYAVLRAANSEGGQRMLARNHRLVVGTQGVVGYVVAAGEPRLAPNVGADVVHFNNPDLPDTCSELALPLRASDQTIGALDVQSADTEAFDSEDVAVLSTLADQVAIAIENARLFRQSQDALAEAEEVQRHYLQGVWQELLQQRPDLRFEYTLEGVPSALDMELPITQQAVAQGELVVASDLASGDGDEAVARAALSVPIKLRDQVIGVIDLHEVDETRIWTEHEVALAQAVADQMAQALESQRLFEQTRALARREALTRRITDRIRDAMDVDTILQTAIRELGQALGAPRVYVRLSADAGGSTEEDGLKPAVMTVPVSPNQLDAGPRGE